MLRTASATFLVAIVLAVYAVPSQATTVSAWGLLNSVTYRVNSHTSMNPTPDVKLLARYAPKKQQYMISVFSPCGPNPLGGPDDQQIVKFTPAKGLIHTCFTDPNLFVGWRTPGAKTNPTGIKEHRMELRKILEGMQWQIIQAAGCKRHNRQGYFRTVHHGCPKMPLASEFGIDANTASLKWNKCRHRGSSGYKSVVFNDPFVDPNPALRPADPPVRTSTITTCSGAVITQVMKPAYAPAPPPAPDLAAVPPPA